jgi:cytidylate kinase
MQKKPVVAIDGPSGVGKSTVAKGVARQLDFQFIDTGALYRTVALIALNNNIDRNKGKAVAEEASKHTFLFDSEGELSLDGIPVKDSIRTNQMAKGASLVATHKEVRDALLDIQHNLGASGGVVLEGRDIGTVVFPDAGAKFFLVASVKERARRRYLQLKEKNSTVTLKEVEKAQIERDRQDTERELSPLKKADDAIEINCEHSSAQEIVDLICQNVKNNRV